MNEKSAWRDFDPERIARFEKENYVAYYQRDWIKLLRASVGMLQASFGLSFWQALYAAYLVARAEIAFAPFPDNDIPRALSYTRRFYAFLRRVHHLEIDVEQAAQQEVNWWSVHRRLFANPDNGDLVEALARLYALAYNLPIEAVRPAAHHRAQGMLFSDYWVKEGKPVPSPLLAQEEEELCRSYQALRSALQAA